MTLTGAAAAVAGWHVRNPSISEYRPWPLVGAMAGGVLLYLAAAWLRNRARRRLNVAMNFASLPMLAAAGAALAVPMTVEAAFQWDRLTVWRVAPERIASLGRHLIVGFTDWDEITARVEQRSVGGIFIRRHNVAGRDAQDIAKRIAALQEIRVRQGLLPLWVATDQEGGPVARLSPPLAAQSTLREAIADAGASDARDTRVSAYATLQARGLASLGVNLNFAPVVDLDWGVINPQDAHTKIKLRVIARDPQVVGQAAARYCAAFHVQGMACTLKHFPGIGRVFEDTHKEAAALDVPLSELEATDLAPFRHVLSDPNSAAVLMLSHVRVTDLDKHNPASHSEAVVQRYIRGGWNFDGIIVTDDMCMGAIYDSRTGIGPGSVAALNAGVDLILIAWDSAQYYPVMAALLRAQDRGRLGSGMLSASEQRLSRAMSKLQDRLPAKPR